MTIQLIQANCLEWLPKHKGEFNLVVTDSPYILNPTTGGRAKNDVFAGKWTGNIGGKEVLKASIEFNNIKFKDWMPLVFESLVSQAHFYTMVNDKNLPDALNAAKAAGFRLHNVLVWKKNNCTPNKWYMKNGEFIIFLYKGKARAINNLGSQQIMEITNISGKNKLHPTQKPVGLLRLLIENSSKIGDNVLDPFMGSGSTGKACAELDRKFTGIEIDKKFIEVAQKSLAMYKPEVRFSREK